MEPVQTLLPMSFNTPNNRVKSRRLPDKLRAAAMEILQRIRVGLDIPSRAEVLDLAKRLESISEQLEKVEKERLDDRKLVETLRQSSLAGTPQKPATKSPKKRTTTRAAAKKPGKAEGSTPTGDPLTKPKRKPRARKPSSKGDDK